VGYGLVWFMSIFRRKVPLWLMVFWILVVGLGWEAIELFYPMGTSPYMSWEVDTAKDLVLDTLGAVLAWYATYRVNV
jgi:hypothetical protein